jgi:hypothetical protein
MIYARNDGHQTFKQCGNARVAFCHRFDGEILDGVIFFEGVSGGQEPT